MCKQTSITDVSWLTAIRSFYHQKFRYPWFAYVLRWVPSKLFCSLHYIIRFKRIPNLNNPISFNEHLIAKKLKRRDVVLPFTADKLSAKDFIRQYVGEEYVIQTLKVFNKPDEIAFEGLPDWFVLKATHGCGTNLIVDSSRARIVQVRRLAREWISKDFYWYRREWPYHLIKPRVTSHRISTLPSRPI